MITAYWIAIGLVVYCYLGYPLAVAVAAKIWGRRIKRGDKEGVPSVSVVIAVWNEEDVIAAKVENLLSLDYPPEKLEILIGSDGSTDRTAQILYSLRDPRLRFFDHKVRRGKPAILNDLVKEARHEIIFLTDARQVLARDALMKLVGNFADQHVGCVSGELVFERPQTSTGKGVDLYWRYEKFIREKESQLHSLMGATGAVYAVRRELFPAVPEGVILDDMYVPFRVIEKGCRAVFDTQALAFDKVAEDPREEYRRKVRTICGNYQIFAMLPQMLVPFHSPIAIQLFSHKLLRIVVPFLLIFIFCATWNETSQPLYYWLGFLQVIFYVMAVFGALLRRKENKGRLRLLLRLCYIPYIFCVLNGAALAGFWRFITSRQDTAWEKARSV